MSVRGVDAVDPRMAVEKTVTAIWERQLDLQGIDPDEDFFELGGHSLHAVEIVSELEQAFGVAIPLRDFYRTPTIGGVVEVVVSLADAGPRPMSTSHDPT
ncbi:acyl carrier protein [Streptomyces sp. NPDC004546]|uniref:acyl carrier protein n=1 Tax=unclassified Streptomyces TaxID=2593676 RepID=UPI0033B84CE6